MADSRSEVAAGPVEGPARRSRGGEAASGGPVLPAIGLVSVGIVSYNEEAHIDDILGDLVSQDFPHERIEILIADGMSTDATRDKLAAFAQANGDAGHGFARVRVLDNPKRVQPAGLNVLIDAFSGDALLRVDAHARIPADFVRSNVAVLDEGECACGGPRPAFASPATPWSETLLLAEESAFGSSVADYRHAEASSYVSSVFQLAIRREVAERVGHYDERLIRTEDNDYCYRIRKAGYRIRFDTRIRSRQAARSTLGRMLRQKWGNGYWVGRTAHIQPACLRSYHFAPFAFVLAIAALVALGAVATWWPLVICAALYLVICIVLAVRACVSAPRRHPQMLLLPLVFFLIHLTYGVGTLAGLVAGIGRRS